MADRDSRVSRPIEAWERERYVQGSEACRNYSNLTMSVRTLAQQVSLAAAAGLAAALIGQERIEPFFSELMWVSGLVLTVFALSLFFVDWHYQSAFTAIRNHLATIEARHHLEEVEALDCHAGPWTAHLDARTQFKDHLASYVPFLLIGDLGLAAALYGLHETPIGVSLLGLAAVAVHMLFVVACRKASRDDRGFKGKLGRLQSLASRPGSAGSQPPAGDTGRDDADDGDGALPG